MAFLRGLIEVMTSLMSRNDKSCFITVRLVDNIENYLNHSRRSNYSNVTIPITYGLGIYVTKSSQSQ